MESQTIVEARRAFAKLQEREDTKQALADVGGRFAMWQAMMQSSAFAEFTKALDTKWEQVYGEPPPKTVKDFQRWAVRLGFPAPEIQRGDWTPADFETFIEGHLLRLKDNATLRAAAPVESEPPAGSTVGTAKPKRRPNVVVDLERSRVRIGNDSFEVKPNVATIIAELVEADGEWVAVSEIAGVRPRDLQTLPQEVAELVERKPGGGTRIPQDKLWLS